MRVHGSVELRDVGLQKVTSTCSGLNTHEHQVGQGDTRYSSTSLC